MRLDQYLVENSFVESRNISQTLIKNGDVEVDGVVIKKPSFKITNQLVEVKNQNIYVSRAANKLKGFFQNIDNFDIKGFEVLDIGASTGGFTQIVLEYGVDSVTSLDVGDNQLHEKLVNDNRVEVVQNQDIRTFFPNKKYDLITCDVSFISIEYILDDINRLAEDKIIILFKPQFEVGKSVKRDRKGVIVDDLAIIQAQQKFEQITKKLDWQLTKKEKSILKGKEGNIEYFYYFKK